MKHIPVLLHEIIEVLNPKKGDLFIDGTLGSGGHAFAILERLGRSGTFLGVDVDIRAISNFKEIIKEYPCIDVPNSSIFIEQSSYTKIPEIIKRQGMPKADGLVIDLGFSSDQIDDVNRGFSFKKDAFLDMRYNDSDNISSNDLTAYYVINKFKEEDLKEIIKKYGEERFLNRIVNEIVLARKNKKIETTKELAEIIKKAVPPKFRYGKIHPATRTFQALRIFVNNELENLELLLKELPNILKKGGKASIISFHSLEDRMVKNYFRNYKNDKIAEVLTKKPIIPSSEEIKKNPRSRSAKLRTILFL